MRVVSVAEAVPLHQHRGPGVAPPLHQGDRGKPQGGTNSKPLPEERQEGILPTLKYNSNFLICFFSASNVSFKTLKKIRVFFFSF